MVVEMQFGSHVYGTNTPNSDLDVKGIYVPKGEDILLQRVKNTIVLSTKKVKTARNESGDIDSEIFSLQKYLELLLEGQTVAMDMLFTPKNFYRSKPSPTWELIQTEKHRFIHKGYSAFAVYCRQQANKYGIKGSRINAVRNTLELLKTVPGDVRLSEFEDKLSELTKAEHIEFVNCKAPNGGIEKHLEVCNRKIPMHAKAKFAIEVFQRIFDQYGHRALLAEKHQGIDWKALMHAVRICGQSKELLLTGGIEFPRPDRAYLLEIRKGERPYKEVAEKIEDGLLEMESASLRSTLRSTPDFKFAEELIIDAYHEEILKL